MATAPRILRARRTDNRSPDSVSHVLVHVTQLGRPLHLKLVATEHEHLYHATLQDANGESLQIDKFNGSTLEWRAILRHLFLQEERSQVQELPPGTFDALEIVVASITDKGMKLDLRRNFDRISQTLGFITLEQDDEREEVSFPAWTDLAVAHSNELRTQLEKLQASMSGQQEQLAKMNRELDDLVQAKKEHDADLLSKCAALLNAKKLKIRDQQRLLARAKIDPQNAQTLTKARPGSGRKAGESRKGKRKASDVDHGDQDEEVHDGQAEDAADDDSNDDEDGTLEQQAETPEASDQDETLDEDGYEARHPPSQLVRAGVGNGNTAIEIAQARNDQGQSSHDAHDLPPKRELPFAKKSHHAEAPKKHEPLAPAQQPAGDDDDETDDEL